MKNTTSSSSSFKDFGSRPVTNTLLFIEESLFMFALGNLHRPVLPLLEVVSALASTVARRGSKPSEDGLFCIRALGPPNSKGIHLTA